MIGMWIGEYDDPRLTLRMWSISTSTGGAGGAMEYDEQNLDDFDEEALILGQCCSGADVAGVSHIRPGGGESLEKCRATAPSIRKSAQGIKMNLLTTATKTEERFEEALNPIRNVHVP